MPALSIPSNFVVYVTVKPKHDRTIVKYSGSLRLLNRIVNDQAFVTGFILQTIRGRGVVRRWLVFGEAAKRPRLTTTIVRRTPHLVPMMVGDFILHGGECLLRATTGVEHLITAKGSLKYSSQEVLAQDSRRTGGINQTSRTNFRRGPDKGKKK